MIMLHSIYSLKALADISQNTSDLIEHYRVSISELTSNRFTATFGPCLEALTLVEHDSP